MTIDPPRPTSVRIATALLALMAALTLLSMVGTVVVALSVVALDPTLLGGQLGLALPVGAVGVVLGAVGGLIPVAAAMALRSGQPAGRIIGTLVGVLWLGSPMLPLGLWLLYALWGDPETGAWIAAREEARRSMAAA